MWLPLNNDATNYDVKGIFMTFKHVPDCDQTSVTGNMLLVSLGSIYY